MATSGDRNLAIDSALGPAICRPETRVPDAVRTN
jgi:hypothetical protein